MRLLADYPCGKPEEFFTHVTAAKETLDGIPGRIVRILFPGWKISARS